MKTSVKIEKKLTKFMNKLADFIGKPKVFAAIILVLIVWFGVSTFLEYETWFDIMDVSIFIASFLILFVVQGSQNADTKAIQDKLDEIIEALPSASNQKEAEEKRLKKGEQK